LIQPWLLYESGRHCFESNNSNVCQDFHQNGNPRFAKAASATSFNSNYHFFYKKREKAASFYIFLLLEQPLTSCYQITVMEAEFGQMYPYLSIYID